MAKTESGIQNPSFQSSELAIVSKPKLNSPILIAGLPGIGLVSKLTTDNLVKALGAKPLAMLHSPHFPNQVLALKSGKLRTFSMKLYYAKAGKRDAVILTGDLQPLTVEGQYEVAAKVLSYFKSLGGKTVVSMAGFATNRKTDKPKIFCSTTSKKFLDSLLGMGGAVNEQVVPIVGMAGMIPALSKLFGLKGACLLVETPGTIADAGGAAHLTKMLGKIFDAKISTGELEKRAKKASKIIEKMEKQAQAAAEPAYVGAKADHDTVRYIS